MSENKNTPEPAGRIVVTTSHRYRKGTINVTHYCDLNTTFKDHETIVSDTLLYPESAITELAKQRDELQEEVNALKERAEYDLAEFARTLDISYAEINLLKKQRDELLVENASLKTEFSQCSGLLDDAHRHIEQLEAEVVFQRNAHDQAQALLLEQGHQLAASSPNYPWNGCTPCDGGSRAGYECPVCRQSDCRGCVKGGAA